MTKREVQKIQAIVRKRLHKLKTETPYMKHCVKHYETCENEKDGLWDKSDWDQFLKEGGMDDYRT